LKHHLRHHLQCTLSLLFTTLMPSDTTIYFNMCQPFPTQHTTWYKVITYEIQNTTKNCFDLLQRDYTALYPRKLPSPYLLPWEPQLSRITLTSTTA
jgi:hypothetical protein